MAPNEQKYTIIRGEAFEITEFVKAHPGGDMMLELSAGRDSTVMYESAHLRDAVADKALNGLPKADVKELEKQGFRFDTTSETFCTPKNSDLHNRIRARVVKEVMQPLGKCQGTTGARGIPSMDVVVMLTTWVAAVAWFLASPGYCSATMLGMSMTWIGMGLQHTGNHGSLTGSGTLNYYLGLADDVCVGGSSLVWRYHHQVSHHAYCNDKELDQDVHSSFPFLRLDLEQELSWYHAYQYLYAIPSFSLLYFSVQLADLQNLVERCCYKVNFLGSSQVQIHLAYALKTLHFGWLFALPCYLHGAAALYFSLLATMVGSFWTALLFVVSHNLEACKPGYQMSALAVKDWAVWQIETSASWGGATACYLTGGLNLQIEHHLLPCVPHHTHPAIAKIVQEECLKLGVRYNSYDSLSDIVFSLVEFLKIMGRDPQAPSPTPGNAPASPAPASPSLRARDAAVTAMATVADVASEVQKTAQAMAKSAGEAQQQIAKEDAAEAAENPYSGNKMIKPLLLVAMYQGLQEWYTSYWPQDNMAWQNTTVWKPASFTVLYFCMIFFGTMLMKDREPNPRLRKYMLTYNLYQVILNAWCVWSLTSEAFLSHDHPFHFTVEESSYKLSFFVWVHYNNKFIELFDTTFMVLNKKHNQVSFLHVYHHVLIMWSWWAVCVWGCGGIAWFSAMMNSAIHVVMYGYYAMAALKIECPWKKSITMMQLGQFCLCMISAFYALARGIYPFYLSLLNIFVMLNMLVLFWSFFKKAYGGGKAAAMAAKPVADATPAAEMVPIGLCGRVAVGGGDKKRD